MKYFLGRLVLGSSSRVPLSKSEFEQIKNAKDTLVYALAVEELMDHVLGNFMEWEIDLLKYSAESMVYSNIQDIQYQRRQVTRRLVNILTTCRMYTDQTQHITKKISKNLELDEVKLLFNKQYDSSLSYRIMEALRNFTQHQGIPLHALAQSFSRQGLEENDKMTFTTIPKLQTKYVLNDSQFKKSVADEIKHEKELDLRKIVKEYISCISSIHHEIEKKIKADINRAEQIFTERMKQFSESFPEEKILGLNGLSIDGKGIIVEQVSIFERLIEDRKELEKRRRDLAQLHRRVVVSEELKDSSYK